MTDVAGAGRPAYLVVAALALLTACARSEAPPERRGEPPVPVRVQILRLETVPSEAEAMAAA